MRTCSVVLATALFVGWTGDRVDGGQDEGTFYGLCLPNLAE